MITKNTIVYEPGDSLWGMPLSEDAVDVVEYKIDEIIQDQRGADFPIFLNLLLVGSPAVIVSTYVQEVDSNIVYTQRLGKLFSTEAAAIVWRDANFRPAP